VPKVHKINFLSLFINHVPGHHAYTEKVPEIVASIKQSHHYKESLGDSPHPETLVHPTCFKTIKRGKIHMAKDMGNCCKIQLFATNITNHNAHHIHLFFQQYTGIALYWWAVTKNRQRLKLCENSIYLTIHQLMMQPHYISHNTIFMHLDQRNAKPKLWT